MLASGACANIPNSTLVRSPVCQNTTCIRASLKRAFSLIPLPPVLTVRTKVLMNSVVSVLITASSSQRGLGPTLATSY